MAKETPGLIQEFCRVRRGFLNGWMGDYELRGKWKYLDFLYHAGLGSGNSQGFGMFERLSEKKVDCLPVLSQAESTVPSMGSESVFTQDNGDVVIDFDKINQLMEEMDTKEGKKSLSGRSL